ncbi:hypothetical protein Fmac_015128 [Flemingia macrophylla]|uniref:Uncharacterized protein n=1 Tax=Flemingia macrophylla TaxID=520843 RepID=A0ABD1MDP5_9FABA
MRLSKPSLGLGLYGPSLPDPTPTSPCRSSPPTTSSSPSTFPRQPKPFSSDAAYGTPVGPMIRVKDEPFVEGYEAAKYPSLHKCVGSSAIKIKTEPCDDEESKEIHHFVLEGNESKAPKYPHLHKYVGSSATKIKIEPYDDEQSKEKHPFAPEGNEYEAPKYPHLHKYVGSSATKIKIEPCDDEESKEIHPFVPEANDGTGNAKFLKFDLNEVPAEDEE